MEEKLKQRQEASLSDPSIVVTPPSPPTRHEKWKKARQRRSGDYISDEARIVAEKIVSNLFYLFEIPSLAFSSTCDK